MSEKESMPENCKAVVLSLGASVCASVLARVYAARVYMEGLSDFGGYFGNLPELRAGSGQLFLKPEGHRILIQTKYLVNKINIESTCDKSRLHPADP